MATLISFGLLAALSGMEVEVHEKTKEFIVALWKAGIPGGCCLECFKDNFDDVFQMKTGKKSISKEQKAALVVALVEAGFSFDEIRGMELHRRRSPSDDGPTDEELIEGGWLVGFCPTIDRLVEAVEKLHAGTE